MYGDADEKQRKDGGCRSGMGENDAPVTERNLGTEIPRWHRFGPLGLSLGHVFPRLQLLAATGMFPVSAEYALVDSRCPIGHVLDGEPGGLRRAGVAQSRTQFTVAHQQRGSVCEATHITRLDQGSAYLINNQLRQSTDTEGDGRHAKCHRVDDGSPESL